VELDTEAELEAQLTDVSNVLTNNDNTDSLSEGATNLYFTNTRARAALSGASLISYNSTTGVISLTNAAIDHGSVSGLADDDHTQYHTDTRANTWLGTKSTTDLSEGSNLYFMNERVDDRVNALLTAGTHIVLTYDDAGNTLTVAVDQTGTDARYVQVGGDTMTGALSVQAAMSGYSLTVSGLQNCDTIDTDANGNLVCGTDGGGISQSNADNRYVNTAGDTMTGALTINGAGLSASGAITTEGNVTINADNGAADAVLTFGNDLGAEMLTFSDTNNRFEFTDDLYVAGDLNVTGAMSGKSLYVAGAGASPLIFADDVTGNVGIGTINPANKLEVKNSNADVKVLVETAKTNGIADIELKNDAQRWVIRNSINDRFIIRDETGTENVVKIFPGSTTNSLSINSTGVGIGTSTPTTKLEVVGTMSGRSLYVSGTGASPLVFTDITTDRVGIGTNSPGGLFGLSDANTYLDVDGSNNLTFTDAVTGTKTLAELAGSGTKKIALAPEYAGATFQADGSNNEGSFDAGYDSTNFHSFYAWTTSTGALQDYDIVIRVQLPVDFVSWDASNPVTFDYKTTTTLATDNKLDLTMLDTANVSVTTLTGNTGLVSSIADTWATYSSSNDINTGATWTAGGWVTIKIKTYALTGKTAYSGEITLKYNGR